MAGKKRIEISNCYNCFDLVGIHCEEIPGLPGRSLQLVGRDNPWQTKEGIDHCKILKSAMETYRMRIELVKEVLNSK